MGDINTLDQIEVVKRDANAYDGDILANLNTLTQVEIVKDDTEPDPPTPPEPPEPTSKDYKASDLTFNPPWTTAGLGVNNAISLMKQGRIVCMKGGVKAPEDIAATSEEFKMFTLPEELRPVGNFNTIAPAANNFVVDNNSVCVYYTLSIRQNGDVYARKISNGGAFLDYQANKILYIMATWYVKE